MPPICMMVALPLPFTCVARPFDPLERFGIKLMSIGFLLEDPKSAVIWRGPMLHGALQQFLKDVAWGELDFLILDLARPFAPLRRCASAGLMWI